MFLKSILSVLLIITSSTLAHPIDSSESTNRTVLLAATTPTSNPSLLRLKDSEAFPGPAFSPIQFLNFAQTPDFYKTLAQTLFNAQIRARTDPKGFAREMMLINDPVAANILMTKAIPAGGLTYISGMRLAAKRHCDFQGPLGLLGHNWPNGTTPYVRLSWYGTWKITAGENIMYGPNNALAVMAGLIKSPAHFANIFRPAFKAAAVSCGPHAAYGTMCTFTFAGGYVNK